MPHCTWNLPGPGIKSMCPALLGRFSTTGPPGKSLVCSLLIRAVGVCECLVASVMPMDCSPPGSSVHRILQARILEWVAMPSSRDLPEPGIKLASACVSRIASRFFYTLSHLGSPNQGFSSVQLLSRVRLSVTPWIADTRPPCPSPIPRVHLNSCPSSRWCHPAISSSVIPFSSCPQSLPASESFPMSQLFSWGCQSIGVSALASFLPKNSQDWSPLEWTGCISLQSKGLSRVTKYEFAYIKTKLSWNWEFRRECLACSLQWMFHLEGAVNSKFRASQQMSS